MDMLGNGYLWIKAAHLIFVIFWMAGMFMLPRFLVYHQEAAVGSPEAAAWVDREATLRKIILTPSMVIVWVLGIVLAVSSGAFSQGWLSAKLIFVIGLSGYHGWMVSYSKKLARGGPRLSGKTLRLLNEIPGIAVAIIVILVIVRPF